jgi:putative intracellular protease/amidase
MVCRGNPAFVFPAIFISLWRNLRKRWTMIREEFVFEEREEIGSMRRIAVAAGIVVVVVGVVAAALPAALTAMGLNAPYEGKKYELSGHSALIITTSQGTMGVGGKATGVYASELTVPYYEFLDAGMEVDVASVLGGRIPIELASLKYPLLSPADRRFRKDAELQAKVADSMKIDDVDFSKYDLIFMAGGWGAAYDLGQSAVLGEKITKANAEGRILGSVCHGALGFLKATEVDGKPLMQGKAMTAVTDKQVEELGIESTPLHPETEFRRLGADFRYRTAFRDFFATLTVTDGNLVTGQNQNSGSETAQRMMELLANG